MAEYSIRETNRSGSRTATTQARKKRRLAMAALGALSAGMLVLGGALPASAGALNSWAWSHNGTQTHLYTDWSDGSTYNTRVSVQHTLEWSTLCDTQGHAWGKRSTGSSWSSYFGYSAGCNWVLGSATTYPNIYFWGGSKLYGEFRHDGLWQDGVPSINV